MADKEQFDEEFNLDNTNEGLDLDSELEEDKAAESTIAPKPAVDPELRKKIIYVAGAILAFIILYKFVGSFFTSAPPSQDLQPKMKPMAPSPQSFSAPIPTPQPALANNHQVDDLTQKIKELGQNNQVMHEDLDAVRNQVGDMSNQVNELQNQISKISTDLMQLNETIAQLKTQAPRAVVRKSPVVHRRGPTRPSVTYSIKAIIPGRAWLMSSNGSTITVSEGSAVPGYGVIKLIDPDQGKILTSSGRTIEFNSSDT
jgi:intracellular multiplication protein IcmG